MNDGYYDIECGDCGWTGNHAELECSEEDDKSGKPVCKIKFNCCPDCGSTEIYDIPDDD